MEQERSIEAALKRGALRMTRWTEDGTLIRPQQLAKVWDLDMKTVQAAVQRGNLFEVWVNERPYFASALVGLGVEAAAKVCQALDGRRSSSS